MSLITESDRLFCRGKFIIKRVFFMFSNGISPSIPPHLLNKLWDVQSSINRETTCELEVDSWPWFVTNRNEVKERFLEPSEPILDRTEKLVHSLRALWKVLALLKADPLLLSRMPTLLNLLRRQFITNSLLQIKGTLIVSKQ